MKRYQATYEGRTLDVDARHPHEAQTAACLRFGLAGRLQHLVQVKLRQGEPA